MGKTCNKCKKSLAIEHGLCVDCKQAMQLWDVVFGRSAKKDKEFKEWCYQAKKLQRRTKTVTNLEDKLMYITAEPEVNAMGVTVYKTPPIVHMKKRAYKKYLKTAIRAGAANA